MRMELDATNLVAMFRGIANDAHAIGGKARPVMSKAGLEMKKKMQADANRSRHFKVGRHINYDLSSGKVREINLEVGPEKVGAGNLANIAYFGASQRRGGRTIADPEYILEAEADVVEEYLGDLLEGLGD